MVKQPLGEQESESVLDDFQSMDLDINSLIEKFIKPIDRYRSRTAPTITGPLKQPSKVSLNVLKESRAHAFYRILGLPTITPNGVIVSPGFNPKRTAAELQQNEDIAILIPSSVKDIINKRENQVRTNYEYFSRANIDACVFSIAIATPYGQRQFMIMNESKKGLEVGDAQQRAIPNRHQLITSRYKKKDGSEIVNTFSAPIHILRPFITDPVICANLGPKSGSSSVMIAAPFLDKDDTEYEHNNYVKRPGLEFILRLRLKQHKLRSETVSSAYSFLDLEPDTAEVSSERQREIAAALANVGVDEADVKQTLKGAGLVELYTLNNLVKTYKGLIDLYVKNIEKVEEIYKQIIWVPLSNEGGPEKGSVVSTTFVLPKKFLDSWDIEKRIRKLKIKSSIASTQLDISDDLNYSDFAISEFQNLADVFSRKLSEEESDRENLEAEGSNALRIIELISGEVSGLGLIDIFAIYMALWSLPISVLLDLIDDEGINRLSKISELKIGLVTQRKKNGANAVDSYNMFEKRIINILSYGDRLYRRALSTPNEEEGGDIIREESFA